MAEWINPEYADLVEGIKKDRRQQEAEQRADQTPRRYFLIPGSD
ncbi:hypothetical protein [Streptomyces sp. NBC_00448]